MSNPTPTTLREILSIFSSLVGSEYADMKNDPVILLKHRDQATRQIQEQLKALLPKKINAEMPNATTVAYNRCLSDVEKAIEEWAK